MQQSGGRTAAGATTLFRFGEDAAHAAAAGVYRAVRYIRAAFACAIGTQSVPMLAGHEAALCIHIADSEAQHASLGLRPLMT